MVILGALLYEHESVRGRLSIDVREYDMEGSSGWEWQGDGGRGLMLEERGGLMEHNFCQNLPRRPHLCQNRQNKFCKGYSPENLFQ